MRALRRFSGAIRHRYTLLIVEPRSRAAVPWWEEWQAVFEEAGGQADEWRFSRELHEIVRRLDRAAGLDHRELTGRLLFFRPKAI